MFRKIGAFMLGYFSFATGLCALGSGVFALVPDTHVYPGLSPGFLLANCIVNLVLCLVSFLFARRLNRPANRDKRSHEQIILDLAQASHGTLSIAEVAAHTALSVAEAKEGIEALTRQGVASVEFNEKDDVFYRFPGLDESKS